jgi:FlaA1/EpsC-like NDP-sugar epimerase
MGATKRVAEILVERMSRCSSTCFLAVRFGNVLGSNGSVVPLFLEQIRSGGPVTVTHPDVRRYFMLTSEAVQLVLHAAAIGESGIYILEMGEQVRIVDMARSLIRLSGFVPEEEIQISYVGLRPGEKMFEELIGQDEKVEPSQVDKIMRVVPGSEGDSLFEKYLASLESAAVEGDVPAALGHLVEIVPNFQRSAVSR